MAASSSPPASTRSRTARRSPSCQKPSSFGTILPASSEKTTWVAPSCRANCMFPAVSPAAELVSPESDSASLGIAPGPPTPLTLTVPPTRKQSPC